MTVLLKDQKLLWGRAAGRCSMPICRTVLVEDETATDDPALIGENCHIVGEKKKGPRGADPMPLKDRNFYANLILLCRNHHRIIDQQTEHYTIEELHRLKQEHEAWVRDTLGAPDPALQRDIEAYASIIDEIAKSAEFENWLAWSSSMLSHGQPKMRVELDESLFELRRWIARRPQMPGRYPDLEIAIRTFKAVLDDLQETFRAHAAPFGKGERLITEKFYQIRDWNPELYAKLASDFDHHVDLVQDLMCELTRAANLLIQRARETIAPNFMSQEGDLMIQSGPGPDLGWLEQVLRYTPENLDDAPIYPGLPAFEMARLTRDLHFGNG